jgi:hypothetical protein
MFSRVPNFRTGGAYFLGNMAPRGAKFPRKFDPGGGAKFGGGANFLGHRSYNGLVDRSQFAIGSISDRVSEAFTLGRKTHRCSRQF